MHVPWNYYHINYVYTKNGVGAPVAICYITAHLSFYNNICAVFSRTMLVWHFAQRSKNRTLNTPRNTQK